MYIHENLLTSSYKGSLCFITLPWLQPSSTPTQSFSAPCSSSQAPLTLLSLILCYLGRILAHRSHPRTITQAQIKMSGFKEFSNKERHRGKSINRHEVDTYLVRRIFVFFPQSPFAFIFVLCSICLGCLSPLICVPRIIFSFFVFHFSFFRMAVLRTWMYTQAVGLITAECESEPIPLCYLLTTISLFKPGLPTLISYTLHVYQNKRGHSDIYTRKGVNPMNLPQSIARSITAITQTLLFTLRK